MIVFIIIFSAIFKTDKNNFRKLNQHLFENGGFIAFYEILLKLEFNTNQLINIYPFIGIYSELVN